jgi:hypothetical protein
VRPCHGRAQPSDGPDETDQFASDGDDCNMRVLPSGHKFPESSAQRQLRIPCPVDDGFRYALMPTLDVDAYPRRMPVAPARLDQQLSRVAVAGFGNTAVAKATRSGRGCQFKIFIYLAFNIKEWVSSPRPLTLGRSPVTAQAVSCTPVMACHLQGESPCRSWPQLRSRR